MLSHQRHLLLDLDSTLIQTNTEIENLERLELYTNPSHLNERDRFFTLWLDDVTTPPGTGVQTPIWGFFRPHLPEFITFIRQYFTGIHVWSAGQYKYVHAIVDLIFGETPPTTVLTYEDCEVRGEELRKPIWKLMSRNPGMTYSNTFCLDDREETFADNPRNGILIPAYEPELDWPTIKADETSLLKIIRWWDLPRVREAKDVRRLRKPTFDG